MPTVALRASRFRTIVLVAGHEGVVACHEMGRQVVNVVHPPTPPVHVGWVVVTKSADSVVHGK